jgi:hypothetical protein
LLPSPNMMLGAIEVRAGLGLVRGWRVAARPSSGLLLGDRGAVVAPGRQQPTGTTERDQGQLVRVTHVLPDLSR